MIRVGDLQRIGDAVGNKYSPPGESVCLTLLPDGDEALLKVRDTGIRNPPTELTAIFDLFVQSEDSLGRSDGGMEVGLTLVRSAIELHGRSVAAHSDGRGLGSEFVVRIPLSAAEVARPEQGAVAPASRLSRVVVVEDLVDSRDMLETLLRLEGCEVVTAVDGHSGLETIRQTHPDFALVHIGLPGIDGYELARQLRADTDNHDILLVALTGCGQSKDRESVLAAGFDDHLVKPLQIEQLSRILSR